jgi:hypothetical protein
VLRPLALRRRAQLHAARRAAGDDDRGGPESGDRAGRAVRARGAGLPGLSLRRPAGPPEPDRRGPPAVRDHSPGHDRRRRLEPHRATRGGDRDQAVGRGDLTPGDRRDPVSWDTLSLPSSDTQAYARYGTFTINVLHSPDELSTFTKDGGSRLVRDGNGIYWPPGPDSSGYWSPAKVYGNVVLTLTTQSRSVGNQFRMLDAILSTLGQSASAVNAKLPPNLLSCQARGITPGGTSEGTCTENGVSRTVVSRGHTLHVPGYDVQLMHTKLGNEVKSPFPYSPPMYAKGQFVAIGLHVTNTGNAPLDGLYDAELEIGGRYYSQDDQATFQIADPDTFPMQPEDSGNTAMIFDVPSKAAAGALTQGELVFPGEKDSTIDYSSKLDAIRLGHVTVELSQPAPSGSPAPGGSPALSD